MKITFIIADSRIINFYALAESQRHGSFPPASDSESRRWVGVKQSKRFNLPTSYEMFSAIKASIVKNRNEVNKIFKSVQRTVESFQVTVPKNLVSRAHTQSRGLKAQYTKNSKLIDAFLVKQRLVPRARYDCVTLPIWKENGESYHDIIILGLFASSRVAFAVFCEEVLHSTLSTKILKQYQRKFPKIEADLLSESVVGMLLYKLFKEMSYEDRIIKSVVFGWHNGARTRTVKALLFSD
jgi:hypothetical protein